MKRRLLAAGLLAAFVVTLLGGIGFSSYFAIDAQHRAVEAKKSAADADRNAKEANDQRSKVEVTLADSLLRPIGYSDVVNLASAELDALWELAGLDNDRVRLLFVERGLAKADVAERLSRSYAQSLHAAVGLDAGRRRQVLSLLLRACKTRADLKVKVACGLVGVALNENDPAFALGAARVFLEKANCATDLDEFKSLAAALRPHSAS